MPRQPLVAPAFPPTPEDEARMADLESPAGQAPPTLEAWTDPGHIGIVDTPTSPSPSSSSSSVLSRFEFERGKGNEGTKVLLVEWDSAATCSTCTPFDYQGAAGSPGERSSQGQGSQKWSVSWEGKESYNVLAVDEAPPERGKTVQRVYFLLPPGAHIPPLVSIACRHARRGAERWDEGGVVLWTKPMPAIYTASLGRSRDDEAGRRGVLHTLWAEKRLADLAAEIEAEMKANSESIGLQIALQEQDWIAGHFGVGKSTHHRGANLSSLPSPESPAAAAAAAAAAQPAKLRSPIGGKLGEKLRGLKLATSPADLAAASQARNAAATEATRSARVAAARTGAYASIELPVCVHHSLDAVVQDGHAAARGIAARGIAAHGDAGDGEDELFALPLSPRSPEMAKSPFSLL